MVTLLVLLAFFPSIVSATPNIGMLRVSSFIHPRQVAPGSSFQVSLDVEYAIQGLPNNATIRGAIYPGSIDLGSPLWQSDPVAVSNGGDEVWNITLTAPSTGNSFDLTAFALYSDNGTWNYFSNPVNGPGSAETSIKVGSTATIGISVGAPGISVSVNGTTEQTSPNGDASFPVTLSSRTTVSVPNLIDLQNSTRLIFTGWSDGPSQPQRSVLIDDDLNLTANYRPQYLLVVHSDPTTEQWYDPGTNATVTAPVSSSAAWPLNLFGVTRSFESWSGDIQSTSPQVNVTMNSPKTITADFVTDYRPLALPGIFAAGLVTTIVTLFLLQRRSKLIEQNIPEQAEEQAEAPIPACPTCGQAPEPEWMHCIKCGTKLRDRDSKTNKA